jgi:acyl carrier protein
MTATPGSGRADAAGQAGAVGPGGAASTADAAAAIADEIRRILAAVTGRAEMLDIQDGMPLFGQPVALDSLTGTLLLREIRQRFGVDVAGEDLNLDALATLGSLAAFVGERVAGRPGWAG